METRSPGQAFSQSPIPGADDAARLAAWRAGEDPAAVVLPLAVAAAWAYSDADTFATVMTRRGLGKRPATRVAIVNDAMFVCAVAYVQPVGDGAVVSFRGTPPTSVITWLADGTLQKVAFHASAPGTARGYVHGGFYRNTRAIWPQVVEALAAIKPAWVYFTGHSFGGALAVLAAALLEDYAASQHAYGELWPLLRGVFTFGQPMVGDAAFAESYASGVGRRLNRFVYDHDIVPHLPPVTSGWTPAHFGAELRANDGEPWKRHAAAHAVQNVLAENLLGIAAWFQAQGGALPGLKLPYSWGDHAPNNYVRVSLPAGAESGSEFD